MRTAVQDRRLAARIVSRRPLQYAEGPCAGVGLGFDGERKVVFLVPEPDE